MNNPRPAAKPANVSDDRREATRRTYIANSALISLKE